MNYILSLEEIEKLSKGELQVDDVATPENMALISWSGNDIKEIMEIEIDEGVINDIIHIMENCHCGDCVNSAINEYENKEMK